MKKDIVDLLHNTGLAHMSTTIERIVRSSIRLTAHPLATQQAPSGSTFFGGSPDVLPGFVWPRWNRLPLPFIAQIHLSDMAPFDTEQLLPPVGILSFFFDAERFFTEEKTPEQCASVIYEQGPLSALSRISMPVAESAKKIYPVSTITCSTECTLPDYSIYDSTSMRRLALPRALTEEEEHAYFQMKEVLAGTSGIKRHVPLHRLLGHADPVQWDMHDELGGEPEHWQLLLQMDSGDSAMEWGNTGRIYYCIRTEDLQRHDFRHVKLLLQSS